MAQLAAGFLLMLAGIICGIAIAVLNSAFKPHCGEDCSAAFIASLLTWCAIGAVTFPALGLLLWARKRRTLLSLAAITAILGVIAILPFFSVYVYQLHHRYCQTAWQSEMLNADFSLMAIAVTPVAAKEYGTTNQAHIKAWERCVLGQAFCDSNPHSVEARCFGSGATVVISEPDWSAFRRIEDEDMPGMVDKPKDMNLCPRYQAEFPTRRP